MNWSVESTTLTIKPHRRDKLFRLVCSIIIDWRLSSKILDFVILKEQKHKYCWAWLGNHQAIAPPRVGNTANILIWCWTRSCPIAVPHTVCTTRVDVVLCICCSIFLVVSHVRCYNLPGHTCPLSVFLHSLHITMPPKSVGGPACTSNTLNLLLIYYLWQL